MSVISHIIFSLPLFFFFQNLFIFYIVVHLCCFLCTWSYLKRKSRKKGLMALSDILKLKTRLFFSNVNPEFYYIFIVTIVVVAIVIDILFLSVINYICSCCYYWGFLFLFYWVFLLSFLLLSSSLMALCCCWWYNDIKTYQIAKMKWNYCALKSFFRNKDYLSYGHRQKHASTAWDRICDVWYGRCTI